MTTRSPRERLQKLFNKQPDKQHKQQEETASPPASPSAAGVSSHVRRSNSRRSLRDVVQVKGHRLSISRGRGPSSSFDVENTPSSETHAAAQIAAAKAMESDEGMRLPSVPHPSDLSADLQHLTLSDVEGRRPYSEDVADRNIVKRKPLRAGGGRPVSMFPNGNTTSAKPTSSAADRRSVDVADWNIEQHSPHLSGARNEYPAPLQVPKRKPVDSGAEEFGSPISPVKSSGSHSLSHKADHTDLRRTSDAFRSQSPPVPPRSPKRSLDAERTRIKRSSLEKPLPPRPSDEFAADLEGDRVLRREVGEEGRRPEQHRAEYGLADKDIDVTGIVDLSTTEDTTLHERWAPAVTHETIIRKVHEIRHEEITREIHNHHVFHRVLPIVDIEVLPSRHFVPVEGGYAEIAEEEVPGRAGSNAQWVIAETVSKMLPESKGSIVPERFSAREFKGTEGDYKETTAPEGFKRTETWWVHPPTYYEPGAISSGQTYPFYIGSPDPQDDGLRAKLPEGKVIGVSPLLAKQQREHIDTVRSRTQEALEEQPPVPPPHKIFPAELVDAARAGPGTIGKQPGMGWS